MPIPLYRPILHDGVLCSANLSTIGVSVVQPPAGIDCRKRPCSPCHEQHEAEACETAYCKALPMLLKLPYTSLSLYHPKNVSEVFL